MRSAIRSAATALALSACGSGSSSTTQPPVASIVVNGRAERSSAVRLQLMVNNVSAPGAVFSVQPAAAATVVAGDSLHLLQAGPITITGRGIASGDSVHAMLVVDVATPPTIVFDRVSGGYRDIWSVQLDGGALTQLTVDSGDDRQPTARAGHVYYISLSTGTPQIWKVPLAGGAAVRVSTDNVTTGYPALAPSGTMIVYSSGSSFPKIMLADTTAGNATRFAAADAGFTGAIENHPTWSPTGDRIAYMTTRDGLAGIYVGSVAGATGSATQLVSGANGYANVEPAWSADGNTIAFASDRGGPTDLYLITLANNTVTRLTTTGKVGQPAWLADGRLVYSELVGANAFVLQWLDPADTAHVHVIPTGAGSAQHPAPTP